MLGFPLLVRDLAPLAFRFATALVSMSAPSPALEPDTLQVAQAVAREPVASVLVASVPTRAQLEFSERVARATLLVENGSCTGFVAGAPYQVVTAAHCVPYPARSVTVQTATGRRLRARLDRIDRDTDMALFQLDVALPIDPLVLSKRDPGPGESLLFVGRGDRRGRPQLARVTRVGRCPSLPKVDRAVFTTLEARPGDSGAPLVDSELSVVALVHGGARCHIAAPVAALARQLADEPPVILAGMLSRRVSPTTS